MALGDGYIAPSGYIKVRHCLAQEDYARWKRDLIRKHVRVTECYPVDNNGYGAWEWRTRTCRFLKLYHRVLYPQGIKNKANRKILDKLTPLGLAIWYMDDGGLSQKKAPSGIVKANDLMLNTHLTQADNQIIIDYFVETWGIQFTQVKNRGWYRLRCGTAEARKFISIVRPYVEQVPSMAHKLKLKSPDIRTARGREALSRAQEGSKRQGPETGKAVGYEIVSASVVTRRDILESNIS